MNRFLRIKRKLGILTNCLGITPMLCKLNLLFFHWKDRSRLVHWGIEDSDKKYMYIRPMSSTQGLLSTYFYVMNNVKWAKENGFIPFVDFETDKCQYYTGREIHGTKNAWEYYFNQPSSIKKEEIFKKNNILLSGWTFKKKYRIIEIPRKPESLRDDKIVSFVKNNIAIKQYIYDIAQSKYTALFSGNVLGIFMRGTDYVKIKPKGHAAQPTLEQVISKINEYLTKYTIDKIYVVTEDYDYFTALKDMYGDKVFSSDDYFIKNYKATDYIESAFDNDPYERGLNYIIRILLLNRCDYLISGITNGSLVSCCWEDHKFKDEYWFDLGNY